MPRDEVEAAYFALLRAREELADLHRYEEYLRAELQRLRRAASERDALATQAPAKLLRALRHTEQPLADAVTTRRRTIEDELGRLPDRVTAAEEFVTACEAEHDELKRGR